jgi:hypothetical protein
VVGTNTGNGGIGVIGIGYTGTATGVFGTSNSTTGYGVYAKTAGATTGWSLLAEGPRAALLGGAVQITGPLTKPAGSFKIDHPLDPANKYLSHSFVESPDMKNIYDGVATLDGQGQAIVTLPAWFEALNQDFRYQLTAVGAPGPGLYVAAKIANNQFAIGGGSPGGEVSWQVTGIRHDTYARDHRIPTEANKPPEERGTYIYPQGVGQPASAAADRVKHPLRDSRPEN